LENLTDAVKRKILYRENCINVLFEDKNNRVNTEYYKKKAQGKQDIVSIKGKTYFLGRSFRYNKYGVPYYKIKEDITESMNWEDIKTIQTLSAAEIDEYTDTKIFIDVLRMSSGEINWKVIGIIGIVLIAIVIIYMKIKEGSGGAA